MIQVLTDNDTTSVFSNPGRETKKICWKKAGQYIRSCDVRQRLSEGTANSDAAIQVCGAL